MPSLNLDLTRGLALSGVLALILTIVVFFRRRARGEISKTTVQFILLGYIHFWVLFMFLMYFFIFSPRYDALYLILWVLMVLHWMVIGECILSYIEKHMIDPQYRIGEDSMTHPFIDDMFSSPEFQNMYHYVERMMGVILFCVVLFRYATRTLAPRYNVHVLFLSVLLLINGLYANTNMLAGVGT